MPARQSMRVNPIRRPVQPEHRSPGNAFVSSSLLPSFKLLVRARLSSNAKDPPLRRTYGVYRAVLQPPTLSFGRFFKGQPIRGSVSRANDSEDRQIPLELVGSDVGLV